MSNYSLGQIDELIQATEWHRRSIRSGGVRRSTTRMWSRLHQRGVVLEGYSPFKVANLNDPTLVSIASEHDATTAQVIVAWHVAHGFVVIPKSVP